MRVLSLQPIVAAVFSCLLTAVLAIDYDYGTFASPAARVRPRFRYWLPDASVDASIVTADIQSAGSIGAGGVEFLPFYDYGEQASFATPIPDWSETGFGSPKFNALFVAALKAHQEAGLKMDFAVGPNQGQGVPAAWDDEGLQWDLVPFSVELSNGSFDGEIPGWGTGDLVGLVSANVLSTENITLTATSVTPNPLGLEQYYLRLVLKTGSLVDQTNSVSDSGQASLTFDVPADNSSYRLFAYYQKQTLYQNLNFTKLPATTIWDNGSFIVDHYSARGARTVIDFWENYILTPETKELLAEVGNFAWEDSVEIQSNISWTPSIPSTFSNKYNYSLIPYLPLVAFMDNNLGVQATAPGPIQSVLDSEDEGVGYLDDFRAILAEGYGEYLETFVNWTHTLGIEYSAQVSYNLAMDMEVNIPKVDAPECESLAFSDNIDAYRQYVGPAVLANKTVISNEMGAVFGKAYAYPLTTLLGQTHKAIASGVNQFVFHGQDYTGDYWGTTWPGYTAFIFLFSEQYSQKDPAWETGFGDGLHHVGRLQYSQQKGKLIVDVAIYNKVSATNPTIPTLYNETDLSDEGYTYNYISADNLALFEAEVVDGVLAPDGPAYRALIIPGDANITASAIGKIQEYAAEGLPIILSGGTPGYYYSGNGTEKGAVLEGIEALQADANVYSVADGGAADLLTQLGIIPNVRVSTNGSWIPTWREDAESKSMYCFVLNDSENFTTGTIDVPTTAVPYIMDTWTGEERPLLKYETSRGRTLIPLSLNPGDTILLSFKNATSASKLPGFHAISAPSTVLDILWDNDSSEMEVQIVAGDWDLPVTLTDGRTISSDSTTAPAPAYAISNWTLTVEHWEAPANLSDAGVIAVKHNTTQTLTSPLPSWIDVPALANVSGVGYYTADITWSGNTSSSGLYLSLPTITHIARVSINNTPLPPLNPLKPQVDITPYLTPGTNTVTITTPALMWNYLRSIIDDLTFMYLPASTWLLFATGGLPAMTDNGLIGEVEVIPFTKVVLS